MSDGSVSPATVSHPPVFGAPEIEEQVIVERRVWNMHYLLLAFAIGVVVVILVVLSIAFFNLSVTQSLIVAAVLLIIYAGFLFFLLEPEVIREIETREVRPVIQIVEKPVIRIVEKPVIKRVEVIKEVEKPIYIERPVEKVVEKPLEKKAPVPVKKPEEKVPAYVGSVSARRYHNGTCRFSKLIKKKYKIVKDSPTYFIKEEFIPCEICILKTKKD